MKTILTPIPLLLCVLITSFISCKKEITNNTTPIITSEDESTVITETKGDTTTVIIRPSLKDGQDCYVSIIDADTSNGNINLSSVPEIVAGKYYHYGQLSTQRTFIRFDSLLKKVPLGKTIVSAHLMLYGKSSSLVFPYGNSYYPGSPNPENSCWIQRVTTLKQWQESTITWNNQPATTTAAEVTLPASTSTYNYNVDVLVTQMVRTMVNLQRNNGFCMRLKTEEPFRGIAFATSESTDVLLRPRLIIKYY